MNQREYIQECCNRYGDFKVAKAWKDTNGQAHWTKWMSVLECWHSDEGLRFLDIVNNRTIFPCEIVLDVDKEPIKEKFDNIIKYLDGKSIQYKAYFTGSKGYHIHLICHSLVLDKNISDLKKDIRSFLIRKFDCDLAKNTDNAMIALENAAHWKTGRTKTLVKQRY